MAETDSLNILPLTRSKVAEEEEGMSRIAEATSVEEMFLNEKPSKPTIPETFDDVVFVTLSETAAEVYRKVFAILVTDSIKCPLSLFTEDIAYAEVAHGQVFIAFLQVVFEI